MTAAHPLLVTTHKIEYHNSLSENFIKKTETEENTDAVLVMKGGSNSEKSKREILT